ncbi:MAG: DNA polymerase/3'-5' exonuclease PolX [Planctomycetota bacterium]
MSDQNKEIAEIFSRIADALEFKNENTFRVNAYRRAARTILDSSLNLKSFYEQDKLQEIPGIGAGMSLKIAEYFKTSQVKKLAEATRGIPPGFLNLLKIQGVGPKTLRLAYEKLKVKNLDNLKKVIDNGRLARLPGMGERKVDIIARGIAIFSPDGYRGRLLLGTALPLVEEIIQSLREKLSIKRCIYGLNKIRIIPAGSLRRMQETIGDLDILATGDSYREIIEIFTRLPQVKEILAAGTTKASVLLSSASGGDHQVDLRVVEPDSFGAALLYFTGSKAHNIKLRGLAKSQGLKINASGLFSGAKKIAGLTEEEIYRTMGLPWIPPELREDRGEIELARKNKLPALIQYNDIKGDSHVHSHYSDGFNTIEAIARAARKYNYEYIAITDHSRSASYARGLSPAQLIKQAEEIKLVNKKIKDITVLGGTEVDILKDGQVDFPEDVLKQLDLVVASIHSGFQHEATERILRAMDHPYVNVIGHPTGRLIGQREGYAGLDLEKIFKKAAQTGTALEINSFPDRLDLNDLQIKRAKELGARFVISTDSHRLEMLDFIRLGIATARRGGLTKKDVLNTYPLAEFKKLMKKY